MAALLHEAVPEPARPDAELDAATVQAVVLGGDAPPDGALGATGPRLTLEGPASLVNPVLGGGPGADGDLDALPLAGLLFQAAILGFPLIAGWIIASVGYPALFAVLVTLALVQAAIGWWRLSVARKAGAK